MPGWLTAMLIFLAYCWGIFTAREVYKHKLKEAGREEVLKLFLSSPKEIDALAKEIIRTVALRIEEAHKLADQLAREKKT